MVERFSVVVSTSAHEVTADNVDTWAESKEQVGGVRTYIAIWECEDFFSKGDNCWIGSSTSRRRRETGDRVTVTIGGEKCNKVNIANYCNGPLQAETLYYFSLRGYTENGLHAQTPSSSPIVTGIQLLTHCHSTFYCYRSLILPVWTRTWSYTLCIYFISCIYGHTETLASSSVQTSIITVTELNTHCHNYQLCLSRYL